MQERFLIVGLGNVGGEYERTRHNIGFMLADRLAKRLNIKFSYDKSLLAEVAENNKIILAKPHTFMNRSGLAVSKIKEYYKINIGQIITISDDFNLELGKIRVRHDGDTGGHNGLESVMEQISGSFWRIKIGIGEPGRIKAEKYVLEKFKKQEKEVIDLAIDKTVQYLVDLITQGEIKNESFNVGLRS